MGLKNSQYVNPAAFMNRTAVLNSEGFVTKSGGIKTLFFY